MIITHCWCLSVSLRCNRLASNPLGISDSVIVLWHVRQNSPMVRIKITFAMNDFFFSDSEKVFTEIMNRIVEPHGKKFTLEIKLQQMGKKVREAGKYMIGECKERHQISGEILSRNNVKIEGEGLSIWSCKDRNSHWKTCLNIQWLKEITSSGLYIPQIIFSHHVCEWWMGLAKLPYKSNWCSHSTHHDMYGWNSPVKI